MIKQNVQRASDEAAREVFGEGYHGMLDDICADDDALSEGTVMNAFAIISHFPFPFLIVFLLCIFLLCSSRPLRFMGERENTPIYPTRIRIF